MNYYADTVYDAYDGALPMLIFTSKYAIADCRCILIFILSVGYYHSDQRVLRLTSLSNTAFRTNSKPDTHRLRCCCYTTSNTTCTAHMSNEQCEPTTCALTWRHSNYLGRLRRIMTLPWMFRYVHPCIEELSRTDVMNYLELLR